MNKYTPKTGHIGVEQAGGLTGNIIKFLTHTLLGKSKQFLWEHIFAIYDKYLTAEAAAKGSRTYDFKKNHRKSKKIVMFEYTGPLNITEAMWKKALINDLGQGYGFVNYPLWALNLMYIFILPFMWIFNVPITWPAFFVLIALYYPVYHWLMKIRRDTKICSEKIARALFQILKIPSAFTKYDEKSFEFITPNNIYNALHDHKDFRVVAILEPGRHKWEDIVDVNGK